MAQEKCWKYRACQIFKNAKINCLRGFVLNQISRYKR